MEIDSARKKGAETLAGRAGEADLNGSLRQSLGAVPSRDFASEDRAYGSIGVANGKLQLHGCLVYERILRELQQKIVERLVEPVVLLVHLAYLNVLRHL